jgi:hypothetical protein
MIQVLPASLAPEPDSSLSIKQNRKNHSKVTSANRSEEHVYELCLLSYIN